MMIFNLADSVNQQIYLPNTSGIEVFIKREDRIHEFVSGNKYRKLKYNLIEAERLGYKTLITYGGAYSNHIAAVASAGQLFGFKTIGVIRGEELERKADANSTLRYAKACGMQFKFVTRAAYKDKSSDGFVESLKEEFGTFYLIPEGGTNVLAVKGCEEILTSEDNYFDYICCAVGTGGTISGLINCSRQSQKVLGFPALKGDFLQQDISKFVTKTSWELITSYHFGGYGKIDAELVRFINRFKKQYDVPLDPVYTGKMLYGIADLIEKGYFPRGAKILAIHTGGLQGVAGMNMVLEKKNLPIIE